jgi:hypothetical protein
MNVSFVMGEIKQGVSPVCATCKRYVEGRERGLPRPKCTTRTSCGSPIAGDTFTQYEGPITDFTKFCFVCSNEADKAIRVGERERMIGVCNAHLHYLDSHYASKESEVNRLLTVIDGGGRRDLLQVLPKIKKSGLKQAMEDTEEEWAHEDKKLGLL